MGPSRLLFKLLKLAKLLRHLPDCFAPPCESGDLAVPGETRRPLPGGAQLRLDEGDELIFYLRVAHAVVPFCFDLSDTKRGDVGLLRDPGASGRDGPAVSPAS